MSFLSLAKVNARKEKLQALLLRIIQAIMPFGVGIYDFKVHSI